MGVTTALDGCERAELLLAEQAGEGFVGQGTRCWSLSHDAINALGRATISRVADVAVLGGCGAGRLHPARDQELRDSLGNLSGQHTWAQEDRCQARRRSSAKRPP